MQSVNGALDRARSELPTQVNPVAQIMGNAINEVADYTAQIPADVAPAQVQRAVRANIVPALRAITGVQFVHAAMDALPVPDGSVDLIVAHASLRRSPG